MFTRRFRFFSLNFWCMRWLQTGSEGGSGDFPSSTLALQITHEIARWPTLRDEFPLAAERGCLGNTRSFSSNVFKAFPSPRPSPGSFLAGRGRRRSAACSPCLCRLSCGLLCNFLVSPKVPCPTPHHPHAQQGVGDGVRGDRVTEPVLPTDQSLVSKTAQNAGE